MQFSYAPSLVWGFLHGVGISGTTVSLCPPGFFQPVRLFTSPVTGRMLATVGFVLIVLTGTVRRFFMRYLFALELFLEISVTVGSLVSAS
jgi:hypothetical protein